ncbi:hypothetical protein SFUMM280S_02576 [Streptomyces fumanus]
MSDHDRTNGHRFRAELPAEVTAPPSAAEETPGERTPAALTGRQRLAKGLWPPRVTRAQLIVALLLFGLGFGLAVQVASNSDGDSALRGARQEDLVRILDELDDRTQRLEDEKQGLEKQRGELENSSDQAEEARKQTVEKERQLGVLAGTVAAQGPGITMTVQDTKGEGRGGHAARRGPGTACGRRGGDPGQRGARGRGNVPDGLRRHRERRREQDQRAVSFQGHRPAAGSRTGARASREAWCRLWRRNWPP